MSKAIEIGTIVRYWLTTQDAEAINWRRDDAKFYAANSYNTGFQAHVGNTVHEGDEFPAIVVKANSNGSHNLQVFLDGNDTYWATSIKEKS